MKTFAKICAALALLIVMQITPSVAASDDLSKPIRVSADGRYLGTADGKPFFWLADTAWPMFVRLDRKEADRYLKDRAAKGFTVIQAVVTGGPWDFHATNRYGDEPYVGGDPSKPNPKYFEHVDWVVDRAAQYGLRVAMAPTWGAVTIAGHKFKADVFNEENARAYGAWLGARYRTKGVIWILGGDTLPMSSRGLDMPSPDGRRKAIVDARPIYDAMAAGIEVGQGRDAFITYHPCGCSYYGVGDPRTSVFFGNRDWLDMNMIQSSHFENPNLLSKWGYRFNWDSRRNHEAITAEYVSDPVRPVVDGEPHYEGIPHDGGKPGWSAYDTRNSAYHALFAGAAGHTFGNNSIHQLFDPSRTKANSAAKTPWWVELDSAGSQQMEHVKVLFLSRPYFSRIPDQSLVRGSTAVGTGFVSATRDRNGAYLMIYSPHGEPVEVDLNQLAGSDAVAWWFDPRTGKSTKVDDELPHSRWHVFEPPSRGPDQDWILVVDDAARKFGPPGHDPVAKNDNGELTQAVTASQARHLTFEGTANFRDLGGHTAAGGKRVRWGVLYRSDALDSLTAADMKLLAQLNIARITDFRSRSEVAKRPDRLPTELDVRYVHVPLEDPLGSAGARRAQEIATANAELRKAFELTNDEAKIATIDRLLVDHYYPRFVRDSRAGYRRWVHDLLDVPTDSAHLFHCTGGADRTGFAAAILLLALGVPKEQVLEDYLLTNKYFFSPEGLALFQAKGLPAMPAGYRLQARYLEASFKAMEEDYGSIDGYLRQGLGIDDEMKRELRARYLE
jgi:protein tyrosine/serine phosphatase